jgi:hypothetical protein
MCEPIFCWRSEQSPFELPLTFSLLGKRLRLPRKLLDAKPAGTTGCEPRIIVIEVDRPLPLNEVFR